MFLSTLNQDDKSKFMEFIYLVANCDDDFVDEEKEIVNNYQIELGLNKIPSTGISLDDIIDYFSSRDDAIKKILLFELYGLILSDNVISDGEKNIIKKIDNKFGLNKEKMKEIKSLVSKLQDVYDEIYDALF